MTMGNQHSSQRSPSMKIENMDLLREEAEKLFTADLGQFQHSHGNLRRTGDSNNNRDSHRNTTGTTSKSNTNSKHQNLMYILRKVSDMTAEDVESSNSTRGTIESPVFPFITKQSVEQTTTSLKARTGSLLSHLKMGFGSSLHQQRSHNNNNNNNNIVNSNQQEYTLRGDLTPWNQPPLSGLPPPEQEEAAERNTSMMIEEEEEESSPKRSSSIPMNRNSWDEEDSDVEHLRRMYDSRTWDMYLRITEARQKTNRRPQLKPIAVSAVHAAPMFPELPEDDVVIADEDLQTNSDHDLVFGDLDDYE